MRRWAPWFLLTALWTSTTASAADRLSCKTVLEWLEAGDLSEEVILQRIARHLGPVQRNIVSCLGESATPRVREALDAKVDGAAYDPGAESIYRIDLGSPDIASDVGGKVARHVELAWPGEVPYVVIFDDDVFETPDWFFEYRDLVTLELVASLPSGSVLAGDPTALGEDAEQLLGEDGGAARNRLRNGGFRRLAVVRRGRTPDDPESLLFEVVAEDLWSEDAPVARVVFVRQLPTDPPPGDGAPVEPTPAGRPVLRRGWFGVGLGISGGGTLFGGSGVIVGRQQGENAERAALYDLEVSLDALGEGRGYLSGDLVVGGRFSAVRSELTLSFAGLVPRAEYGTNAELGAVTGGLDWGMDYGLFVGAGYGREPAMVHLGWYVGAQSWFGSATAAAGEDAGNFSVYMPTQFATGPELIVDVWADRFGSAPDRRPPMAMSLVVRAAFVGGIPTVTGGIRGLFLPLGR